MNIASPTRSFILDDDVLDYGFVTGIKNPIISTRVDGSENPHDSDSDTSSEAGQQRKVRSRVLGGNIKFPYLDRQFEVLDNWEGVVRVIEGDTFFAEMRRPDSKDQRATDEFEIHVDNVPEGDRDLLRVGAVFYLTVGMSRVLGQGPEKTTRLVFRRMPRWSSRDIDRAESNAASIWGKIHTFAGEELSNTSESEVE